VSHNLENPSTRWFFNDWDNEPGMKFCSLAAQGLWFKMLGLAARSREYGVVLIGDHPSLRTDLPALLATSCGETIETIDKLIEDLVTFKVATVDGAGHVINRRMVREAQEEAARIALSAARSAAGRKGADVTNRERQKSGKSQKGAGKLAAKSSGNGVGKNGSGASAQNGDQQGTLDVVPADHVHQNRGKTSGKNAPSFYSSFLSSVSKDTGAQAPGIAGEDPARAIFGTYLAWLIEKTGRTRQSCAGQLGKWRKAVGDKNLVGIVEAAKREAASEPVSWIEAAIEARHGNGAVPSTRAAWAESLP
jgi:hypothetical protein